MFYIHLLCYNKGRQQMKKLTHRDKILLGHYKEIQIGHIFVMRLNKKDFNTLQENNNIIHGFTGLGTVFTLKGRNVPNE
jgi:hypothetical protein